MNRILLLILIPAIILAIILLVFLSRNSEQLNGRLPVLFFSPSPTSQAASLPATPLFITGIEPQDNNTNVPQNQQVQITFNRALSLEEVYISFGPGVTFKPIVSGNIISLVPQSPLVDGLTYRILIKFNKTGQLSKQYQFTVVGTPPSALPDTQPPGAAQQSEEFNRQNHPDIFLANKTPIKQASFDLYKGTLKSTPQEHYSFVAVSKADSAKDDLLSYLLSLGLTQDQINSLDIVYISQDQFNKVSAMKDKLPFFSYNVSIGYDKSFDNTTVKIDQKNKVDGEQTLNEFLKQNGVDSTNWINNLSIIYE